MITVDPIKRATIEEIRRHPWFVEDLPNHLFPQERDEDASIIDKVNYCVEMLLELFCIIFESLSRWIKMTMPHVFLLYRHISVPQDCWYRGGRTRVCIYLRNVFECHFSATVSITTGTDYHVKPVCRSVVMSHEVTAVNQTSSILIQLCLSPPRLALMVWYLAFRRGSFYHYSSFLTAFHSVFLFTLDALC